MLAKGITSISLCPDLGNTPAIVNRKTGAMFINQKKWKNIPFNERMFIILHELGHIVKNTKNEFEADQFAFQEYAKLGLSLKDSVDAMAKVLSYANPQHYDRTVVQLNRALDYDHKVNHQPLKQVPMFKSDEINPGNTHEAFLDGFYGGIHESFLGFGKKPGIIRTLIDNRQENKENRIEGRQNKRSIIAEARADKIRSKGNAAEILAEQGINQNDFGNTIASGIGDLGAGVAAALGGGSGKMGGLMDGILGSLGDGSGADGAKAPEEQKNSKTTWIIVSVIVVVIIAGAVIYFTGKKGKK
jgi:hypothetical protein